MEMGQSRRELFLFFRHAKREGVEKKCFEVTLVHDGKSCDRDGAPWNYCRIAQQLSEDL